MPKPKEYITTEKPINKEGQKIASLRGKCDETSYEAAKPTGEPPTSPVSSAASHRPFTRSQTGYLPKRRRRDDSPPVVVHRARSLPRKKRKSSANTPSEDLPSDSPQEQKLSGPTFIRSASEVSSLQPDLIAPIPNVTQFSFIPESSSSTTASTPNTPSDRRGPRSRVVLPLPVPNLTKKSRGRRVPTQDGTAISGTSDTDTKDIRMYVCKVESCRKCFHRGEHLKRHIRSIHTHEKPFVCLHADCDKRFNRHDNLLQHLKVHKNITPSSTTFREDLESSPQRHPSSTPSPPPEQRYSVHDAFEVSTSQARRAAAFRRQPSYASADYDHTLYESAPEPMRPIMNMAVSSLRTEIPPSPA